MNLDDVIKNRRSSAANGMTLDTADSEELYSSYMATIQQEAERLALIPLPKVPKVKARSGSAAFNSLPGGGRSYRKLLNKMKTRTKQIIKKIPGVMPCVRLYRNISGKSLMQLEQRLNEKQANFSHDFYERLGHEFDRLREDLGAVSRQTMMTKWQLIDHMRVGTESDDDILTCDICGEAHRRQEYQTMETDCIFNGGHLTRYICPRCGVVFGPTKFTDQGQNGVDDDYRVHYLGYTESDASYKEERAFRMMNPDKKKIYLNYGCGKWSKTLQKLRREGFQVYGYEPYAPETNNPYLITSKEDLMRMRFDGIFSNDLLEHLIHPIEGLIFMRSLLADKHAVMSHSTSCYEYKYEYTRFHTHFFLGDSVPIMAEKAKLKIETVVNDLEQNDFYCYVFSPLELETRVDDMMYPAQGATRNGDMIELPPGALLYGPYMNLPAGRYAISVDVECATPFPGRLTSDRGKRILSDDLHIMNGDNHFEFNTPGEEPLLTDFEIVLRMPDDVRANVKHIGLERVCE